MYLACVAGRQEVISDRYLDIVELGALDGGKRRLAPPGLTPCSRFSMMEQLFIAFASSSNDHRHRVTTE
jgi:hypothetical protein